MAENAHTAEELRQLQSLPLESKVELTKKRIKAWYDGWIRCETYNPETKKTKFRVCERGTEPKLNKNERIVSQSKGAVYLSFSGGKDSTVLKHIIDSMYDDVSSLFVNTGLEYPEIQQFVKKIQAGTYNCFNSNIDIVRPELSFKDVLTQYGYPIVSKEISSCIYEAQYSSEKTRELRMERLRGESKDKNGELSQYNYPQWAFLLDAPFLISDRCCDIMKKKPSQKYHKKNGKVEILGTMANESRYRWQSWIHYGCNIFGANHKKNSSRPLSFWTEQDILQYILKYSVPYASIYGDIVEENGKLKTTGINRTGCVFCMFGCHLEKEPNRFQRLKETHPRQYEYCIGGGEMVDGRWQPNKEGLGLGKVLDYIDVKYD